MKWDCPRMKLTASGLSISTDKNSIPYSFKNITCPKYMPGNRVDTSILHHVNPIRTHSQADLFGI